MLQIILMSLGAYVFQVSASPAVPFPPVLPPVNPTLATLPAASLPTGGVNPTPLVLTSVPGASIPNAPATAFPSLPGASAPSVGAPTGLPSLPGASIPSAGVPTPTLPGSEIPTAGLPTTAFPPLPTLTNSVLLGSISAVLSGVSIPTGFPTPDLPLPPIPPVGEPTSLLPIPSLPVPSVTAPGGVPGTSPGPAGSVNPVSIITYLSSAIKILVLLIQLIQETINTGGVRVPGVTELGVGVGTDLLGVLLKVAAQYLDKAGAVGAIAF